MEATAKRAIDLETCAAQDWIEQELAASQLPDARLEKRLQHLVEQMSAGLGRSIPLACQDWAATKAAYRFFSNERISEEQILAGYFEATRERLPQGAAPVLVLHDTTEFTYQREDMSAVGLISKGSVRKDAQGRPAYFTTCRINLHSSSAVTLEGLPLGLTAVKFWSRKAFKGRNANRKAHRAPIEERKVFAGWRTCAPRPSCSGSRNVVCTSVIKRAIFSICSARRTVGNTLSDTHTRRPSGRWRTGDCRQGRRAKPTPGSVSHRCTEP